MLVALQKKLSRLRSHIIRHHGGRPPLISTGDYRQTAGALTCQQAHDLIASRLASAEPFLLARASNTEWNVAANVAERQRNSHSWREYFMGERVAWWWDARWMKEAQMGAGIFPNNPPTLERFAAMLQQSMPEIDILAQFSNVEHYFAPLLQHARRIALDMVEPFFCAHPWTRALAGKKVLVIYPLASQIERLYREKRHLLFSNPEILPEFQLLTLQSVQSMAGEHCDYANWFDALAAMQQQMDKLDYDVALVGAGAYGHFLAAHAKASGRQGLHLGGTVQQLFGIRGHRWDARPQYAQLTNEFWEYPDPDSRPAQASQVEGGAYW